MNHSGPRALFVYIMSGYNRRIYTGVTIDLERRVVEHRKKLLPGFTSRYNFHRLVYYEEVEGPWRRSRARKRSRAGGDRRR